MRLFLAFDVDRVVQAAAAAWVSGMTQHLDAKHAAGLRFARLDALHITLHFLGNVQLSEAEALRTVLARPLSIPPFEASLEEVGAFPPRGAPRVVWGGLGAGRGQALAVHEALMPRLREAGVLPAFEPRGYTPHLTLARLKPGAGHGPTLLRVLATVPPPRAAWTIDHVTLYESDLSENRARYEVRATTRLA